MNVAVIGAGIGGLTIASLLIGEGYKVTVFEKKTKKEISDDIGAGIIVGGNVMDKFINHPLRKDIQKISHVIHTMEVLNDKEKILSRLSLGTQRLNLSMKRRDLRETIHHYVPADCIQYHTPVTYVENRDKEAILYFDEKLSKSFDLCIAADGLNSVMRKSIFSENNIEYQGYKCYRGITECSAFTYTNTVKEIWGRKARLGIVPLNNNKVYWFITVNSIEDSNKRANKLLDVQTIFNYFPQYKYLIENINNETILLHNIYDIKPLDSFYDNRVVLLGDAAHAMTPNTGQGAGQAMEDAIALYHCLKQNSDIHAALYRYDQLRVAHTKKILEMSRLVGKAATLESTLLILFRDTILPLLPDSFMNKQSDFLFNNKIK